MMQVRLTIILVLSIPLHALAQTGSCDYLASPPDAERASGANIAAAWYGGATTRYGHGVLGDSIEADTLYVQRAEGDCALSLTLEDHSVFEDVTPRLADVTGDGRDNIITIESHEDAGASLAIYAVQKDTLMKVSSTPYIGTRYRWLAPIGVADYNDDEILDVAYVETPHLAGVIRIWSFATETPTLLASLAGFSNHRIGENFITGGISKCNGKPRIVIPDIRWQRTMIVEPDAPMLTSDGLNAYVAADVLSTDTIRQFLSCQ